MQDTASISGESPAGKRLKIRKIKPEEPPLIMPFKLPANYPRSVEEGLTASNLIGKTRARFIASVAAALYHKKAYPTRLEYAHVAEQIVAAYPFMADQQGSHVRNKLLHNYVHVAIANFNANFNQSMTGKLYWTFHAGISCKAFGGQAKIPP